MDPATCAATRYADQLHATVERLAIGRRWPLVLSEGNVHLPTGRGIAGLLVAAGIGRRLQAAALSTPTALAPPTSAPPSPMPPTPASATSTPPAHMSAPHMSAPHTSVPHPSVLPMSALPALALPALALSTGLWAFLVDSDEIDRAGATTPGLPPQVRLVHGGRYLPLPPSVTADGPVRWVREPGGHLPRLATVLRLLRPLTPTVIRHAQR